MLMKLTTECLRQREQHLHRRLSMCDPNPCPSHAGRRPRVELHRRVQREAVQGREHPVEHLEHFNLSK